MGGSQSPGMRSPDAFGTGVCGPIASAQIPPGRYRQAQRYCGNRRLVHCRSPLLQTHKASVIIARRRPKKSGAGRNDQIGSRKGSSHARDDDRYPSFNFAQHSRCGTRSGPAVSEPDDAATRIGRHGVPAGAGRPSSTDGTLATALSAQGRGLHQTAGDRSVGASSENLHQLLSRCGRHAAKELQRLITLLHRRLIDIHLVAHLPEFLRHLRHALFSCE